MMSTLHDQAIPNAAGYRDLAPSRLAAFTGHVRLVDVREPMELQGELGRMAGAENVPLAMVEQASGSWNKDDELVVICRSGARSGRAAASLAASGFRRVMNLEGGMLAWNAAHLPVER